VARSSLLTLFAVCSLGCAGASAPPPVGDPAPSVPQAVSSVRPASSTAPSSTPPAASVAEPATPSSSASGAFPPPDVAPPSARSAEPGDGKWQPFGTPREPGSEPLLYTTVIHPHEASRFITLTLVAIDLARLRIELMPGVDDVGKQRVPFAPGLVPARDQPGLVAAFNGGFMPQHGRWGMRVAETTLLPARDPGCTIGLEGTGVVIRSWPALAAKSAALRAFRQTPPCLLEEGELHADLLAGRERAWAGQTPGIVTRRRSALGLSQDGRTLFYALGVEASPKLLATGLRAAGATSAAQLDINWNWTRFLLFNSTEGGAPRVGATLAQVEHTTRDYVEIASKRDFFYLVER
jgi:hypothetical protein